MNILISARPTYLSAFVGNALPAGPHHSPRQGPVRHAEPVVRTADYDVTLLGRDVTIFSFERHVSDRYRTLANEDV